MQLSVYREPGVVSRELGELYNPSHDSRLPPHDLTSHFQVVKTNIYFRNTTFVR